MSEDFYGSKRSTNSVRSGGLSIFGDWDALGIKDSVEFVALLRLRRRIHRHLFTLGDLFAPGSGYLGLWDDLDIPDFKAWTEEARQRIYKITEWQEPEEGEEPIDPALWNDRKS
jgi:hypothetical protein